MTSPSKRKLGAAALISSAAAAVVFAAGLAAPFFLLHFSIFAGDEPYHILNAIDYTGNAAAPLSSFLSCLWGRTFGFSLVAMRTLAACLSTATVLIGAGYYYAKKRRLRTTIWIAGVCLLLSSCCQVFSYSIGWDVFSNFFIVATLVLLLAHFDPPSGKRLFIVFAGMTAALATASRLPSATLLIAAAIPFLFDRRKNGRNRLADFVIFSAAFVTSLTVVLVLIFGSIGEFVNQCRVFSASTLSDDHTFNLFNLLYPYLVTTLQSFCIFFLPYLLLKASRRFDLPHWVDAVILSVFAMSVILGGYKPDFDAFNIPIMLTAAFFCLIAITIHQSLASADSGKSLSFTVTLAVFALPSSALSLVASSKLLVVPLIPILLTRLKADSDVKRYVIAVGIVLAALITFYKLQYAWYDRGLRFTDASINVRRLEGIHTTQRRAWQYEEVCNVAQRMGKHLTVGRGRYLVEYVTGDADIESRHYFSSSLHDEKYSDLIGGILKKEPQPVLVVDLENMTTIDETIIPEFRLNSLMQRKLEEIGYRQAEEGDYYMIYAPPAPRHDEAP